jgi:hypothetical protein
MFENPRAEGSHGHGPELHTGEARRSEVRLHALAPVRVAHSMWARPSPGKPRLLRHARAARDWSSSLTAEQVYAPRKVAHLVFASTASASAAPATWNPGAFVSAQGMEVGVTAEMLVAPAERVSRDRALAARRD